MTMLALQVIDNFLLQYNAGQALLFILILAIIAALGVFRSRRILALQLIVFGLLFLLTPQSLLVNNHWKFFGIALIFIGPMVQATAPRTNSTT